MKQQKGFKYAYVAGIIDGEGCISIHKNNGGHSLSVTVTQNDGRILDYCKGIFGGSIYRSVDHRNGIVIYKWVLPNEKAKDMLKKIKPFLTRKKIEAEVAIAFEIRKRKYLDKWRKSFGVKGIKGAQVKPQPEYMREYKEEQYLKLRALKKEIRPPRAGVTTKQVHSSH